MNELQELYLDLIEWTAYRKLQVPSNSGSEDEYFRMEIECIKDRISELESYSFELQLKKNRRDKNRYRINKKFRQRHYDYINREFHGWDKKPWYNPRKKVCAEAIAKEHRFKRKLRRIPIGKEEFSLTGCGYHKVYEWTWDLD